ncbi:unnamed protein product [Bursaphelenchus okinawaensis]|uniref:Uncharacterized protein n=1 Tax=Bursaphelenchus okinawaensis TaxID=465554 RepID=A0A811KQ23_9BILA|nr:unnamed protein product [Bursaphelenchus okinawaensis]CAG9107710.1 unnamed protein product [Bursaphelenchus okinawaensis]
MAETSIDNLKQQECKKLTNLIDVGKTYVRAFNTNVPENWMNECRNNLESAIEELIPEEPVPANLKERDTLPGIRRRSRSKDPK